MPCTAWWEWKEEGGKCKHRFARADGKPIWFAGLWDTCTTVGEGEFKSTIMTGPSERHLAEYHDRAPVILDEEDWRVWLDPTQDAKELLRAVRPARFDVVRANDHRHPGSASV